jgi:uncharacterized protein (TIGR00255 family)
MKSMTGYGRGQSSGEGYDVSVEVSSVNRKALDVIVALPKEWASLERPLMDKVRATLSRGAVRVAVTIDRRADVGEFTIDEPAVHKVLDRLGEIARSRGIRSQMDYETLFRVIQMQRDESSRDKSDEEAVSALVLAALEKALASFLAMRGKEGDALGADLLARNDRLGAIVETIRTNSNGTVAQYRDTLLARLKSLGLELDLGDERLLKELAFFADRVDTAEELTRLGSHLAQFRSTIEAAKKSDEPVGRKLEFLIQEINREFNTIGSKANNLEVTRAVLDAKNEVERQREQVQNLE